MTVVSENREVLVINNVTRILLFFITSSEGVHDVRLSRPWRKLNGSHRYDTIRSHCCKLLVISIRECFVPLLLFEDKKPCEVSPSSSLLRDNTEYILCRPKVRKIYQNAIHCQTRS